jgi:serine/threonine-protein kinase
MAEVYRAEQDLTGGISRPVAVKVIRPEYSESEDFREMFLDEARTACTLSHPNIVHIYEVGETDEGQLFLAMELLEGEMLSTRLKRVGWLPVDEALRVAMGVLRSLDEAHARGIIHRDLKVSRVE